MCFVVELKMERLHRWPMGSRGKKCAGVCKYICTDLKAFKKTHFIFHMLHMNNENSCGLFESRKHTDGGRVPFPRHRNLESLAIKYFIEKSH